MSKILKEFRDKIAASGRRLVATEVNGRIYDAITFTGAGAVGEANAFIAQFPNWEFGVISSRKLVVGEEVVVASCQDSGIPILYKVIKIGRKSNRRKILARGLNLAAAKALVNSYPDSSRSMVCFTRQ